MSHRSAGAGCAAAVAGRARYTETMPASTTTTPVLDPASATSSLSSSSSSPSSLLEPVQTLWPTSPAADGTREDLDVQSLLHRLPFDVREDIHNVADAALFLLRMGRKVRVLPIFAVVAWPFLAVWILQHLRLARRLLARQDVQDVLARCPDLAVDEIWDPNVADAVIDDEQRLLLVQHAPGICGYALGIPPIVGAGFLLALWWI